MMWTRRVAVVAALAPAVVWAEPPSEPVCIDPSDIVGVRSCPGYGEWGQNLLAPYVFVEVGLNFRHFAPAGATAVAARSTTPTMTTPAAGSDQALTFDERVGVAITHHLYTALDVELGNFESSDDSHDDRRSSVIAALGQIGLRQGIGIGAIAAEIGGGGMAYSYSTDRASMRGEYLAEVRGRAHIWLGPSLSIGGMAGKSLLRKDEWVAGVYFGFHSYAYGGDRW
jgi:hypothetical protein